MFGQGIFWGRSLLQERESSWEITLTEPVLEVLEILPTDWPENIFMANQWGSLARRPCHHPTQLQSGFSHRSRYM